MPDRALLTESEAEAVQLLEDSRSRTGRALGHRELIMEALAGAAFALGAAAMALGLPADGSLELGTSALLIFLYVLARQVSFEVGTGYTSPFVLVLVPMLFLVPAPLVPLHVAAGLVLADLLEAARGRRHVARALLAFGQSWHAVGPALVFSAAAVDAPDPGEWPVYMAALGALFAVDAAVSLLVDRVGLCVPLRTLVLPALWVYGVDAMLAPIGFMAAFLAAEVGAAVLLVVPLMGLLAVFAGERTRRVDHALELSSAYRGTALLLGDVIESDHKYTGAHSRDVVEMALAIGDRLGLSPAQRRDLEFGALLHDVGKIAVPKEIINKPGPLLPEEWAVMKQHTIEGQRMLESVGGVLARVGGIVRASHEAYDGSGYPDGLAGAEIPVEARICAACDAFSAMTTDRPYRRAMSEEAALAELRACAGTQFDPVVVDAIEKLLTEGAGRERSLLQAVA